MLDSAAPLRRPCSLRVGIFVWTTALLCCAASTVLGQTRPSPRSDQKEQEAEEELGDVAEDSVGNETSRELQGKTPAAGSPAAESQAAKIGIPPPPLPPLAPPPSPFVVTFKGTVAVSLFAQDTMTATGTGGAALLGPSPIGPDNWLMGGDVRQTRISMNVRGPELLGATPLAAVELEMA